MAFCEPAQAPRQTYVPQPRRSEPSSTVLPPFKDRIEGSQAWILFSPSPAGSVKTGTQTEGTRHTPGLSRIGDFGSDARRAVSQSQSAIEETLTEDEDLDVLDEGLHAFREPSLFRLSSNQEHRTVLPAHDGLGIFPISSMPVQDRLWQYEQFNSKRKYEGSQSRRSSPPRRLDAIGELDLQINDEKRRRIEQWRMEQSQALLDEVEKETRRSQRQSLTTAKRSTLTVSDDPRQTNILVQESEGGKSFWKKVTRKFIRDIIGIDEPLLSVIVGETLPDDMYTIASSINDTDGGPSSLQQSSTWGTLPERLLHRIARELGLLVNKLSPHPDALRTMMSSSSLNDYAGIPLPDVTSSEVGSFQGPGQELSSRPTPLFAPTTQERCHNASWGLEEEPNRSRGESTATIDELERLRKEREYWERELDIKWYSVS